MNLTEFKEKFMGKNSKWDFTKFKIVCEKCGSSKVEFNGYCETELGYYESIELEGAIIVKCHKCGNAFKMDIDNYDDFNTNGENRTRKVINEINKDETNNKVKQ